MRRWIKPSGGNQGVCHFVQDQSENFVHRELCDLTEWCLCLGTPAQKCLICRKQIPPLLSRAVHGEKLWLQCNLVSILAATLGILAQKGGNQPSLHGNSALSCFASHCLALQNTFPPLQILYMSFQMGSVQSLMPSTAEKIKKPFPTTPFTRNICRLFRVTLILYTIIPSCLLSYPPSEVLNNDFQLTKIMLL